MLERMKHAEAAFLLHDVYLPRLKNEYRTTKSVIAAIPLDSWCWGDLSL
jgi:hypothetical protein